MHLYHDLSNVLTVLQNDGIPVIVLKGAHLAEIVYDNIALRPMGDVDLLIKKDDITKVEKTLLETGYNPLRPYWLEAENEMSRHLPPFSKSGGIGVEIHWTIARSTSPFKIDIDGLWNRAQLAVIAGVKVLTLSSEDLLLYLCLHASLQHRFIFGLRSFCNIFETLQYYRNKVDWQQLQFRAHQWKVSKCLYLPLFLARELLNACVPVKVLKALTPNDLEPKFITWAREQIFAKQDLILPMSYNLARIWRANRLKDKVRTFLNLAFPSPEFMAKVYPASPQSTRIYLYYPIRLKDLLFRYGRTAWRLLCHDKAIDGFG